MHKQRGWGVEYLLLPNNMQRKMLFNAQAGNFFPFGDRGQFEANKRCFAVFSSTAEGIWDTLQMFVPLDTEYLRLEKDQMKKIAAERRRFDQESLTQLIKEKGRIGKKQNK